MTDVLIFGVFDVAAVFTNRRRQIARFADLHDVVFRAVKQPRGSFADLFGNRRETVSARQRTSAADRNERGKIAADNLKQNAKRRNRPSKRPSNICAVHQSKIRFQLLSFARSPSHPFLHPSNKHSVGIAAAEQSPESLSDIV